MNDHETAKPAGSPVTSATKAPKTGAGKLADPQGVTIDAATQTMIARAQELGSTRSSTGPPNMKPCAIGMQGTCCKNCAMGPCRLPLPKGGIEGEDTRKGMCGATANTIAATKFHPDDRRGAAAHSDHGRGVAEVFLSVARKESEDYRIKDVTNCWPSPPISTLPPPSRWTGETLDREVNEIALEVAKKPSTNGARAKGSCCT
jgi:carbon-monoxide dehydrogenase catalytic subunit